MPGLLSEQTDGEQGDEMTGGGQKKGEGRGRRRMSEDKRVSEMLGEGQSKEGGVVVVVVVVEEVREHAHRK